MSRRYYLYNCGSTNYANLVNPANGKILEARCSHKQNEDEASLEVAKWLINGIPQSSETKETTPLAIAFKLEDFYITLHKTCCDSNIVTYSIIVATISGILYEALPLSFFRIADILTIKI